MLLLYTKSKNFPIFHLTNEAPTYRQKLPELYYFKLFKKKPKTQAREQICSNKDIDHMTIFVTHL